MLPLLYAGTVIGYGDFYLKIMSHYADTGRFESYQHLPLPPSDDFCFQKVGLNEIFVFKGWPTNEAYLFDIPKENFALTEGPLLGHMMGDIYLYLSDIVVTRTVLRISERLL